MCLPFNDSAVPRSDLHGGDESLFPYALAYHTLLMPLFPQALCECGEHLVYILPPASIEVKNARNLLHRRRKFTDVCPNALVNVILYFSSLSLYSFSLFLRGRFQNRSLPLFCLHRTTHPELSFRWAERCCCCRCY